MIKYRMAEDEYIPSMEATPPPSGREFRVDVESIKIEKGNPRSDLMLVPEGGLEGLSTAFRLYGNGCMGLETNLRAFPYYAKVMHSLNSTVNTEKDGADTSKRKENDRSIEDALPYPDAGMTVPSRDSTKEQKVMYLANCHFYAAGRTMLSGVEEPSSAGEEEWHDMPWGKYRNRKRASGPYNDHYSGPDPRAGADFVSGFSEKDGFSIHALPSGEGYVLEYN